MSYFTIRFFRSMYPSFFTYVMSFIQFSSGRMTLAYPNISEVISYTQKTYILGQ